jgi:hypothetical protein
MPTKRVSVFLREGEEYSMPRMDCRTVRAASVISTSADTGSIPL